MRQKGDMKKVRFERLQILGSTVQNSVFLWTCISASVAMMVPKIQSKFQSLKQHRPEQDLNSPAPCATSPAVYSQFVKKKKTSVPSPECRYSYTTV
jgi:hypothetical protein